MAVNLTPGAILKLSAENSHIWNDMKPVVQVTGFYNSFGISDDKKWYLVGLSDGSFENFLYIACEIYISNKLQRGSIIQLTKYYYSKHRFVIFVHGLHVIRSKCDIIGDPSLLPVHVPPVSDHDIKLLCRNEDVNNPSASTKKCSSSQTQSNKKRKLEVHSMAVNLTSGALSKISTGKCTSNDLYKPVLQVTDVCSHPVRTSDDKQCYAVAFSDGSFKLLGLIADDIFISNKLQEGSIVQLTNFQLTKLRDSKGEILWKRGILVCDLNVIRSKCGIIGHPKLLPCHKIPLVERFTARIPNKNHVDSHTTEDIDDSHHVEEPPTSKQKPSTTTQKSSSHSSTRNKKRKRQLSNDNISAGAKDISEIAKDVSKMMRLMMDKNKEDDMGACFKKLENIGWGTDDPLYDTALLLFGESADYRKLWLHLKPESCGKWVKNAGSKFGLLD